ncbi:MAG TPA: DUF1549 domain-containing protein [Bdellovibrionota bacterium]
MPGIFFKIHPLLTHLPFALALLLLTLAHARYLEEELRARVLKWAAFALFAVSLSLALTGAGLLLQQRDYYASPYWHLAAGVAFLLLTFFLFFQKNLNPSRMLQISPLLALIALGTGVFLAFGKSYLLSPTTYDPKSERFSLVPESQLARFHSSVRPILDRKCVRCHNPGNPRGELDLTSVDSIISHKGNLSFYTPGNSDKSAFYVAISDNILSERHMPRMAGLLSPTEIETVESWIYEGGFKLTQNQETDATATTAREGESSWAFRKFAKPALPAGSAHPVDTFLLEKWKKLGAHQALPLSREALFRKLSLTVTGLIPTAVDIKQMRTEWPAGYEKSLDRLLASPQYGENLTAYWLDLVAFADDAGFDGKAGGSPARFRRFVVDSLNNDLPYGKFLRIQLSADQAPFPYAGDHLALNFMPKHRDDYVTADYALDSVFSFGLGIEMRCARCHDHKYEPITNEDYYNIANIFTDHYTLGQVGEYELRMKRGMPLKTGQFGLFEGSSGVAQAASPLPSDFARWLTDKEKGVGIFSARVFVDNVWRFVFGKGLVATPGRFGSSTPAPIYLELLNWLTYDFLEHGSSTKHLLRRILTSQAFRSRLLSPTDDPKYALYGRKRLKLEELRDNLLRIENTLNLSYRQDDKEKQNLSELSPSAQNSTNRRSIYFRRFRASTSASDNPFSLHFEGANGFASSPQRPQSPDLKEAFFFNGSYRFQETVNKLALAPTKANRNFSEALARQAYQLILSRDPTQAEFESWRELFGRDPNLYRAWSTFYRILLTSNEFLYIY